MPLPRAHRCPGLLRRWRAGLPLLCAAGWWLTGSPVLSGAPGDGGVAIHCVREGDTIPRLCWRYKVRAEAIRDANPGVAEPLSVGRRLTIPLGHYEPRVLPVTASPARAPETPARQASAATPSPSPRVGKKASSVVTTTRLPPQSPETAVPARQPVTVLSAEAPRP